MKKIDGRGTAQRSLALPSRPLENKDQLAEEIWLGCLQGLLQLRQEIRALSIPDTHQVGHSFRIASSI